MKRIGLMSISIILMTITFVRAQEKASPGIIILNNNDTVRGLIANNSYSINTQRCEFKSSENLEFKPFYPNDIAGYKFDNGKYYVSKNVAINGEEQSLFLEYIVKGKLNVFFAELNNKDRYFVEKEDDKVVFLENNTTYYTYDGLQKKWVVSDSETIQRAVESTRYRGILKSVTDDVPELGNTAENLNLNLNSLIKFSKKYHNAICSDYECVIYSKNTKPIITIGLNINFGSFAYQNPYKQLVNKEFKQTGISLPSLFVAIQMKSISENLNFQTEFIYNKFDESIIETNYGSTLKGSELTLPFLLNYTFAAKYINPYISAGFLLHSLNDYNYNILEIHEGIVTNTYLRNDIFEAISGLEIGSLIGLGLKMPYKSFVFESGLDYFIIYAENNMNRFRIKLGMAYNFNKN